MLVPKNARGKPRGQAIILIVLAMVGIMGVVGLVVDGGNAYLDRRNAQNAADSAALAGAVVRVRNAGEDWVGAVMASAAENGYNNDGVTNTIEVYSPPKSGPYADNVEYLQIIITTHVKTYFANIIGRSEITNVVEAVARTKVAEIKPLLGGAALVSLAPTSDCFREKSFWIHEEGTFAVTGGGIFINSNSENCALIQQGNGSIFMVENDPISIVGGATIQKRRLISPVMTVGVTPINYPPPMFLPEIECNQEANVNGSNMTPGNWKKPFPPEGVRTLQPGVYCLHDGFFANEETKLNGNGVTFKMVKGEFHISGPADLNLYAPQEGEYKGLLLYVPMDNGRRVVLNADANSKFVGTVLAPASHILFKGSDSRFGFHSQFIGYSIELAGDSNIVIVYDPMQNYNTMIMPEVQLIQ